MGTEDLRLRAMELDDLALAEGWMRRPEVARWWSDDPVEQVSDIRAELEGAGASTYRIAEVDGRPVGLIFGYRIVDYPEYLDELTEAGVEIPTGAWSVDYLIGEPDATGRGIGSAMVAAMCQEAWSLDPDAHCILVPVHADNVASWRTLVRAGFAEIPGEVEMEPDVAGHDRRHLVFTLARPERA